MRIAIIGQAAFGEAVFRALRDAGEQIVAVSSVAGTPERPDPLWAAAHAAEVPVFPTGRLKQPDILGAYAATEPDLCVMAFVTHILAERVLTAPPMGTIQYHPSLLPKYRGPTPFGWAVRGGETEIGMTYHLMETTFDTGNILAQKAVPLADDDTLETLWPRLGYAAREILPIVFERLAAGDEGDPQEGGDYQSLFEEEYALLDTSRPAEEVHRQVRAWRLTPFGVAGRGPFLDRDGTRVRVVKSSLTEVEGAGRLECADGPLWIVESEAVE